MPVVTVMNSHHNLPEIFYYLWEKELAPRGGFVDQVLRLIMFHHSVDTQGIQSSMVNLDKGEHAKFCDAPFYKLLQSLVVADNESYILFDEPHMNRCRREVQKQYAGLAQQVALTSLQTSADSGEQTSNTDH